MTQITQKMRDEHRQIKSLMDAIDKTELGSAERKALLITLRSDLTTHSDFEVSQFYHAINTSKNVDPKLQNVYEKDLAKIHGRILYTLETIIDFGHEKDPDFRWVREMTMARIGIEEDILIPVYETYCQ